jgi:hypothetical protein
MEHFNSLRYLPYFVGFFQQESAAAAELASANAIARRRAQKWENRKVSL